MNMLPIFIKLWSVLSRFFTIILTEFYPSIHFNRGERDQGDDEWTAVKLSNKIFYYYLKQPKELNEKSTKSSPRPLAILFLWYTAKHSIARKYEDIYKRRGFDILSVHTTTWDLAVPGTVSSQVIVELETTLAKYNSIVCHSFSSGVSHFGAIVNEIHRRQQQNNNNNNNNCEKSADEERGYALKPLDERIKALVFDCVIDFEIIAQGKTNRRTVFATKYFRNFVKYYLKVFPSVNKYYTDIMDSIYKSPLKAPALAFLTLRDHYNNVETIENIGSLWRRNNVDTTFKYWDDCEHVQIYRKHPEQYLLYVDELLRKVNLI